MTDEYLRRVTEGGCRNYTCREQGRPEFAVWWKCPPGHRLELRYCQGHGPEHLQIAMRGGRLICRECGWPMEPMIEGRVPGFSGF